MVNLLISYVIIYINKLNLLIKCHLSYEGSWYKSNVWLALTGCRIYTHSISISVPFRWIWSRERKFDSLSKPIVQLLLSCGLWCHDLLESVPSWKNLMFLVWCERQEISDIIYHLRSDVYCIGVKLSVTYSFYDCITYILTGALSFLVMIVYHVLLCFFCYWYFQYDNNW